MEKMKSSELVYEGRIFNVKRDEVILQNKRESIREVIIHRGSVAMLPYDEEKKIFYLVKQYRYAVSRYVLEVPAGTLEENEDVEIAVNRELSEEIGYVSDDVRKLATIMSSPGFLTEVLHLFFCRKLRPERNKMDYDENIEVIKMTKEEIEKHIRSKEILDGKTITAFLLWKEFTIK
ncbi:MAG: ADP-ribose pyrophosphatase [bacterium (Candidatus Stahlbacteria) CG23_combo_of_CG06-09_8_20_14_all_34_7]|nr:MAG: ADP-ribose pyrophosphatase [bacterium (Candidatus Stahlbacteria) CG23_combo_of_CG06-09_8_20_14_all_34_7]